jgi:hypothetical protein
MFNLGTNKDSIEAYLKNSPIEWHSPVDIREEVNMLGHDLYHAVEVSLIALLKEGRIQRIGHGESGWYYSSAD